LETVSSIPLNSPLPLISGDLASAESHPCRNCTGFIVAEMGQPSNVKAENAVSVRRVVSAE
jgi:hypothetical protein